MQLFLTKDDTSVLFGSSNHNQTTESFGGTLRKQSVQFRMNFLEDLKDGNTFSVDFLDCVVDQFCFMHLLQEELDTLSIMWNAH
ncbi:hypothetical protein ATANTOWER_018293 [Ataeniobius toweri]|uniref:Uncharacterized protein n=1 Tax=Ataeniobius toweri TaxID=208326 RepID=A0ABU7BQD9_9TELE|nr:hypothetical protein [Ataeniobius toweri]